MFQKLEINHSTFIQNLLTKTFLKRSVAVVTLLATIAFMYFQNSPASYGMQYTWTQSNWATQTANTTGHPAPANWTEYAAKDTDLTLANAGADLQLGATGSTVTQTDDGTSIAGFNLSGRDFGSTSTQVIGSGSSASVKLQNTYAWATGANVEPSGATTLGQYSSIKLDSNGKAHVSYYDSTNYALKYATNASGSWVTTTIEVTGNVAANTSIALDANNKAYISYYTSTTQDLKYATNASGSWVTTTVDSTGLVGTFSSIALDSNKNAYISYYDATNFDLKYATNASGSWVVTAAVDGAGTSVGSYTSIAVDANGKAYVSYYDATNADLKYATNVSGSWVITPTVDGAGTGVGQYTSIALDASAKAYISYYDATNADLKYATNASGSWVTATADNSANNVGQYSSIALDASAKAYISYLDNTAGDLKYATNASGSWVTTAIDSAVVAGAYSSIALDASAKAYISYYDSTNTNLKFATNASGSWVMTTVDYPNTGQYTSIKVDANGKDHISYYDVTNQDLKYATNASESWVTTTVDSVGDVGQYTSIALDGNGKAYISYYDATNLDLKYATNASGSWVTATADNSANNVGQYSSIALDASNKAYISYWDGTASDLKYATNASGSWVTAFAEVSAGNVGQYSSIALDAAGHAHISYMDLTNSDLRYATNATGSWVATMIDGTGTSVGYSTVIALDAAGKIHIGYRSGSNTLLYITNASGSWVPTTVYSSVAAAGPIGFAVDGNGKVHISFYIASTFGDLMYATNVSGSWVTTTVDSVDSVGQYTSLALDSNGNPHVSYWDNTNFSLKYISRTATIFSSPGTFTSGIIDVAGYNVLSWGNLSWTNSGGQTMTVKARSCADSDPTCAAATAWASCGNISSGASLKSGSPNCVTDGHRYLQYQASLSTADPAQSPSLDDITIGYNHYDTNQTLTSSVYDSTDPGNVLANLTLKGTLGIAGTGVKVQLRSSPNNSTWTGWCGQGDTGTTCTGSNYFTFDAPTSGGQTIAISDTNPLKNNADDRYYQYKLTLTSTGAYTPNVESLGIDYVVNAIPSVTNVTASQNSSGVINISYDTADTDNASHTVYLSADIGARVADNPLSSGATTINLSGNYSFLPSGSQTLQIDNEQVTCASRSGAVLSSCTRARNNTNTASHVQNSVVWYVATNGANKTGDGAGIATGTGHAATWTIKSDLGELYYATAKIQVTANDGQIANQVGVGSSTTFALDTKNPTGFAISSVNHTTNKVVITAATENSNYEVYIGNDAGTLFDAGNKTSPLLNQASSYPNNYTYSSMTADPATVYVGVKDAFGNTAYTSKITPAKPQDPIYYDTSNEPQGVYQEFLAWDVVSAAQVGSGFSSYKIYRDKNNSGSFTLLATVTDRSMNYYLDKIKGADIESDPTFDPLNPASYTYKIVTEDTSGDVSAYSQTISDTPNGVGGSDSTPPTISNVTISNVNTTSAKVTWTTDELSDSSVGYSTNTTYLPERGLASMVTSHEIVLTGLTPGTTYNIRVKSHDQIGNLGQNDKDAPGASPIPNFTFSTHPGPAISQVTIPNISNHQATVTWKTTTNANTYVVYSHTVVGGALSAPEEVGVPTLVGGSAPYDHTQTITTYNNVELTANTRYYFYVKSVDAFNNVATDDNGGAFYQLLTTEDTASPIISSVDEPVINNTQATISWTTDEPADSKVEYGTALGGPYPDQEVVATYDESHYVILSGLDPNRDYYYRVVSKDINGNETTSGEETFKTLMNPEQQHPPLSLLTDTASPANDLTQAGSVSVFQPVVLNDTTAVIDFVTDQIAKCDIKYREDGAQYSDPNVVVETGYNTNHTMHIMNLILLTKYFYTIECVDNLPTGDNGSVTSQEFTFTTTEKKLGSGDLDSTAPQISGVNAKSTSGESETITWSTDEDANSLVSYGVASGTYENMAGNDLINSAVANYTKTHEVVVNNLVSGTKYYYLVRSVDAAGNIGESSEGTFTTKIAASLSGVKATSTKLGEATITWISSQKTSSIVEYGETASYGEIKQSTALTTDHIIALSGLKQNVEYFFIVKGKDANNNLYSSQGKFTPKSPPAITGIKIEEVDEHSAKVSFTTSVPTDANIVYTDPQNKDNSGSQGNPELMTNHSITLKNLSSGTDFNLAIKVRDADGNETEDTTKVFTTGKDETAPKIDQVKTDSALAQNDKVQSIISWVTDEPSTTALLYQEGRTGEKKEVKINNNLTTNHVAVITTFKPGIVYYFNVKSVDAVGNEGVSSDYALLTPKNKENIIQIIVKNFTDIFGWAKIGG